MLLIATESTTARTLYTATRDYTEDVISHDDAKGLLRLRKNEPQQLLLSKVIANWDTTDTFFNQELAQTSVIYHNKSFTPCPWSYVSNHDFNRYPQYIQNVNCNSSTCHDNTGKMLNQDVCTCREVFYNIPTMVRINCDSSVDKQQWKINYTLVSGACVPHFNQITF